jgi:hypothetical protein
MTIENQKSDFKIKLLNSKSNLSLHIKSQPAPHIGAALGAAGSLVLVC